MNKLLNFIYDLFDSNPLPHTRPGRDYRQFEIDLKLEFGARKNNA